MNLEMIPIIGHPEYLINSHGEIRRVKDHMLIKRQLNRRNEYRVILGKRGQRRHYGLAKLVATHFVPNPKNLPYTIFKDFDNQNCKAENIIWVSGYIFYLYSCKKAGKRIGRSKIVFDRQEAISKCLDTELKSYYLTLDESWLHEAFIKAEKFITSPYWQLCKSDCFIYFIDRARRFSILSNPLYVIAGALKGAIINMKKEISFDMPQQKILQTDESLRVLLKSKQ